MKAAGTDYVQSVGYFITHDEPFGMSVYLLGAIVEVGEGVYAFVPSPVLDFGEGHGSTMALQEELRRRIAIADPSQMLEVALSAGPSCRVSRPMLTKRGVCPIWSVGTCVDRAKYPPVKDRRDIPKARSTS